MFNKTVDILVSFFIVCNFNNASHVRDGMRKIYKYIYFNFDVFISLKKAGKFVSKI